MTATSFNPRPREGATLLPWRPWPGSTVSIHAPAKGRRRSTGSSSLSTGVSIHAPAKGRQGDRQVVREFLVVSIHAPAKGRPRLLLGARGPGRVSIHAPAKGRRGRLKLRVLREIVSIHAPAKGRRSQTDATPRRGRFQSTPPRRGDECVYALGCGERHVSIHAPAKGRHPCWLRGRLRWACFNPRPREGATRRRGSSAATRGGFNPRPREGATSPDRAPRAIRQRFQSTPPRRGDTAGPPRGSGPRVSIHAPAKGRPRRRSIRRRGRTTPSFNPRPREGATARLDRV